jgi:hypothetical protein
MHVDSIARAEKRRVLFIGGETTHPLRVETVQHLLSCSPDARAEAKVESSQTAMREVKR